MRYRVRLLLHVTNLRGAKFNGADLEDANFIKANLREADFRGAKNIDKAKFNQAHIAGTKFDNPDIIDTTKMTPMQKAMNVVGVFARFKGIKMD